MTTFQPSSNGDSPASTKAEPSSGPVRNSGKSAASTATYPIVSEDTGSDDQSSTTDAGASSSSRAQAQAPVKSACTFCRSRKSRCNGKQPCAACISRGRVDDCIYTISRRGGKPKPKGHKQEPLEAHLEKLLGLSELPHLVRIPNAIPQFQSFQDAAEGTSFQPYNNIEPSQLMGMGGVSVNSPLTNLGLQSQHMTQGMPQQYGAIQQQPFSPLDNSTPQHHGSQSSTRARSSSLHESTPSTPIRTLLSGYYRLLYRFAAVLPDPQYIDVVADHLKHDSPLTYALQCVLAIIMDASSHFNNHARAMQTDAKAAVRAEAHYYGKLAYEAIDNVLENAENQQEMDDLMIIEVIQALCIMVIYEYGSARALKSRLKVDSALTLAMSKGLHRLSPLMHNADTMDQSASIKTYSQHYLKFIPDNELYETKKRVWWTLWALAMWTSYNTGRIPTVRADDPRVTCELPTATDPLIWSRVVSSLQGLLLVQDRVLALAHIEHGRLPAGGVSVTHGTNLPSSLSFFGRNTPSRQTSHGSMSSEIPSTFSGQPTLGKKADILQSMAELDNALQEQMQQLQHLTTDIVVPASYNASQASHRTPQDDLERFLQFVWATQVYTTSLTLHIGQAFQGATLFERKLCFLSTISDANDAAACQMPMPNAFDENALDNGGSAPLAMTPDQDLYARGPFAPRESLQRCVDASDKLLLITRNLRQTEASLVSPNPFNACSFVLVSFVCLMQALAISSNVSEETTSAASTTGSMEWNASASSGGFPNGSTGAATPSLLRSAQSAALFTPTAPNGGGDGYPLAVEQANPVDSNDPSIGSSSDLHTSRQEQLQQIWGRVKEAKDALQDLSHYWDMAIPMSEEVSGCLEASQFLLSQQNSTSVFSV